jgi:hypothetical protein
MKGLTLKPQEIRLDDPRSCCMFRPSPEKPFVATRAAMDTYGPDVILEGITLLQLNARRHHGLDYLQVFEDKETGSALWFIEDGEGGAITALLPSDY